PTLVRVADPKHRLMVEEIFGPVVTLWVYPANLWEETLAIVDGTSPYALTGAVFAQDRAALEQATLALRDAAGNFYRNDKPTGDVAGGGGGRRGGRRRDRHRAEPDPQRRGAVGVPRAGVVVGAVVGELLPHHVRRERGRRRDHVVRQLHPARLLVLRGVAAALR